RRQFPAIRTLEAGGKRQKSGSHKVAAFQKTAQAQRTTGISPRRPAIIVSFPLTYGHCFGYTLNHLAHSKDALGRGYSRKRSECGARARNDTVRSRAVPGIFLSGTTAGAGGAFPGLGLGLG